MRHSHLLLLLFLFLGLASCTKEEADPPAEDPTDGGPRLILKFRFDSTQVRLNNLGGASTVPAGRGAQSPRFNKMSAHYVEFAPTATTQLGQGDVVYFAPETTMGGANAIDHDLGLNVADGQAFVNIPLSDLGPGTYQWLRVSLAATFGSGTAAFGSVMLVSSVSTGSVGWVVAGVAASLAGVWVLSVIGDAPCGVGASRRWRTQS